jgi:hypothetical protein
MSGSSGGGKRVTSPNRYQMFADHQLTDKFFNSVDTDMGDLPDTLPARFEAPEAKGADRTDQILNLIMSKISGITTFMHDTSIAVNRLSNTLNSVVDQLATLQIQMSAVREVNTQLKSNITIIEEKFKKMQGEIDTKPTPTFASVAGSGLPPHPNVDMPPPGKPNGQTLQGKNAKKEKLIQALYPKTAREVIVSFA